MSAPSRSILTLIAVGVAALTLTGCAQEVPMKPAEDSNNPRCAEVTLTLPDTLAGLDKRRTNAQATGAWGDPAAVLLHCGVTPPGPTTDRCVTVDGVDWVFDDSREKEQLFRFTTYGRNPAVEVFISSDPEKGGVSGTAVLSDLGSSVGRLPQVSKCLNVSEVR
ncbi:DUF3515 domain-containing protein [Mycetocola tolaasinivorans]|uniref:DUF3515 domain-containing protein n=1 Tax=Mycetocola tolaasinivorans TaxID=76635 RepID=A0A3L7A8S1_9MICO|nr:DUF3515 domain-containing protein [Mycetocola tolaasinivorans]RLP76577.1 DUF3515 domain-containing protein [Mycetocola tolaasinivorans]